jgi:hypothetical protein
MPSASKVFRQELRLRYFCLDNIRMEQWKTQRCDMFLHAWRTFVRTFRPLVVKGFSPDVMDMIDDRLGK